MAAILRAFWIKEAVSIEKVEGKLRRVRCPECGYEMPVFYDASAGCTGVKISCKGRNCRAFFAVKIKDGKQIR